MAPQRTTRIMIVDDNPVVRLGLAFFLQAYDAFEYVSEAGSGAAALPCCAQSKPDVVLLDMALPGEDEFAIIRAFRTEFPDVQIIALSDSKERRRLDAIRQAGAAVVLPPVGSIDELAAAIRMAAARSSTGAAAYDQ